MEGFDNPPELRGLIANSFTQIFQTIEQTTKEKDFMVTITMIEIYNEQIRDLLGKDPKQPLELQDAGDKGMRIKGIHECKVSNLEQVENAMKIGRKNRAVGSTLMNQVSSRSHSILTIVVETSEKSPIDGESHIRVGKLNLVDLAGSERAAKTGATGDQLREGIEINLSLSALGNVISALVSSKASHVPYRTSKLTRILQDSLGGNTKTVMVANISPAEDNKEETLSTLRYATRAKEIKNKPTVNQDPKDAKLKAFYEEIQKLKKELEKFQGGASPATPLQAGVPTTFTITSSIDEAKLNEMMEKNESEKRKLIESMKNQSEEEKKKLLVEQKKIEEERRRIEDELKRRHEQLEMEKKEKEELTAKIAELQSAIVCGGNALAELNKEQEEQIRRQNEELERRKQEELRLKREMEEQMDERLALEEQYASIQEEVDIKTKKLKKLWNKFQLVKAEIGDLQQEFQEEREDYLFTIREYERELRLKQKIIDYFIPKEEVEKIRRRAVWDDEADDYKIKNIHLAGNYTEFTRPQSAARSTISSQSARFKTSSIISLELDMPERTTQDYENYDDRSNAVDSVTSIMVGDNMDSSFFSYGSSVKKEKKRVASATTKRPKTASKKTSNEDVDYPQAKGLVKSRRNT
jgi:myosin heavy subunit